MALLSLKYLYYFDVNLIFFSNLNASSKTIILSNPVHFYVNHTYGSPYNRCLEVCGTDPLSFTPFFISFSHFSLQEHPSLGQLSEKLIDNNINVIFAVQGKQFHWYKVC